MTTSVKRRLGRIASSFNSRARKHHSLGVVSWQMLVVIDAAANGQCHYCAVFIDLWHGTWDHVIALSEGGRNDMSNIARCCTDCQRKKFTKDEAQFTQHKELLVTCPVDGVIFKPRWAEWLAGRARYCSHACAGAAPDRKELVID